MALITVECLDIASKQLKIEQIAQVSQLFQLFHFLMRPFICINLTDFVSITKLVFAFGALCLYAQVTESLSLPYFR